MGPRSAKHIRRRFCHGRRAGAVLELALTMPLLVMLSFGLMEYGYYMYVKVSVQGAARDGVRNAIIPTSTNSTVSAAVTAELASTGIPSNAYSVSTSPTTVSGVATGTAVTVTVTLNWSVIGINVLPTSMGGIPTSKQIICAATMYHE